MIFSAIAAPSQETLLAAATVLAIHAAIYSMRHPRKAGRALMSVGGLLVKVITGVFGVVRWTAVKVRAPIRRRGAAREEVGLE